MKSAILTAPGRVEITDREPEQCTDYDVLVRVETCGVCRTDRKATQIGQRDLVLPRVLGHEVVGYIAEIGDMVTDLQVGDYVQVYPGLSCGICMHCLSGNDHLCSEMRIIGFSVDGGFTEYLLLRGKTRTPTNINILPARIDSKSASLAEPLACCVNLLERLMFNPSTNVVIFGAGPLGILTAQLAQVFEARCITVVEPHPTRRREAEPFSDYQFDSDTHLVTNLRQIEQQYGIDIAIPCCPDNEPFALAMEVLSKRGQLGFFSGLTSASDLSNNLLNEIHYRELSVVGSYGCSLSHNKTALNLLSSEQISIKGVASRTISWLELPGNLVDLNPSEFIFTFFEPCGS